MTETLHQRPANLGAARAIQPDFATLPRKVEPGARANLVGLTRERLRAVLIEAGTPERQAGMRTGQLWQWIYQRGVSDLSLIHISEPTRPY